MAVNELAFAVFQTLLIELVEPESMPVCQVVHEEPVVEKRILVLTKTPKEVGLACSANQLGCRPKVKRLMDMATKVSGDGVCDAFRAA